MYLIIVTAILLACIVAAVELASVAGRLSWALHLRVLYAREYLASRRVLLHAGADTYRIRSVGCLTGWTNAVRVYLIRLLSRAYATAYAITVRRNASTGDTMDTETRAILAQLALAISALTARLDAAPPTPAPIHAEPPPIPVDAHPALTNLVPASMPRPVDSFASMLRPLPPSPTLAGFTPLPRSTPPAPPLVDTDDEPTIISGMTHTYPLPLPLPLVPTPLTSTVDVYTDSDDRIVRLERSDGIAIVVAGRSRAPLTSCESLGALAEWASKSGRHQRAIICGASPSGARYAQRIGLSSSKAIGGVMPLAHAALVIDAPTVRTLATVSSSLPVPGATHSAAPVPVPAPAPSEYVAAEPTPEVAPAPETPTPARTSTRLHVEGTSPGQSFAPSDRLVVFVDHTATLARTSGGDIRWLIASSKRGLATLADPTSRRGFHAYEVSAVDLSTYLSCGQYH